MQEQERIANEEAEKRLKAALTAKREPGSSTSRVASPAIGASATSEPSNEAKASEAGTAPMEVDTIPPAVAPKEEVDNFHFLICIRSLKILRVRGYLSWKLCLMT